MGLEYPNHESFTTAAAVAAAAARARENDELSEASPKLSDISGVDTTPLRRRKKPKNQVEALETISDGIHELALQIRHTTVGDNSARVAALSPNMLVTGSASACRSVLLESHCQGQCNDYFQP